jgi:hypothetical protein
MKMLEDLNKAIVKYFNDIILTHNFNLYEEYSKGMGALKKYKNDYLKIQILNDRGIISLYISPVFEKEDFRDVELLNSFIILENSSSELIGKWDREKILNKRLDLNEQASVIKDNWSILIKLYDEDSFRFTMRCLNKIGLERSKLLFG